MPNRYSNFPDSLDQLKLLPEVQEMTNVVKQKIARYSELVLKVSLTAEEEIELQTLINETRDFQLNSSDWNKTNGVLMETQRYIKENIMGDIGALVDNGEMQINNSVASAKTDISQTVISTNNDINIFKNETIAELNQKIADIVAKGNIGIDYFKNRFVLTQNSPTVKVNISEYNRSTDFLIVFINGLIGVEGINYTMDNDDITLRAVGGIWEIGDEFDFIALKRTVVIMDRYDAGLFADGTIRKEKLTVALQNEISNATTRNSELENNKQDKIDSTLNTTSKTIVGAINELNNVELGDIRFFATNPPDNSWLLCDGSIINKNEYPELTSFLGTKQYPLKFESRKEIQIPDSPIGGLYGDGYNIYARTYFKRNNDIYIVYLESNRTGSSSDGWDYRYSQVLKKYDRGTNTLLTVKKIKETNNWYNFGSELNYIGKVEDYDLVNSIKYSYTTSSSILDKAEIKILKVTSSPDIEFARNILITGNNNVSLQNARIFYHNNYLYVFVFEDNKLYYKKISYVEYLSSMETLALPIGSMTIISNYDISISNYLTMVDNEILIGSNSTDLATTSFLIFNLDEEVSRKISLGYKFVVPFIKQDLNKYGLYYATDLLKNVIYKVDSTGNVSRITLTGMLGVSSISSYTKDFYNNKFFIQASYNGVLYTFYSDFADFREYDIFEGYTGVIGILLDKFGVEISPTSNIYNQKYTDIYDIVLINHSGGNGNGSILPDIEGGTAYIKAKEV